MTASDSAFPRDNRGRAHRIRLTSILVLGLIALGTPVSADEREDPGVAHIPILMKILTFDRALQDKHKEELLVVVAAAGSDSLAGEAAAAVLEGLLCYRGQMVFGRRIRAEVRSLREILARNASDLDVLYLTPGVEPSLPRILEWSGRNQVLTFTAVASLESKGVSVWLGGDARQPRILINLLQVRAEGHDFDARLLALATVVR